MKEKLGAVAQYWFWIATAVVTLLSVGIWWVSSGKLITEYEKNASQLDSDAAKITTVRNALGTHPNEVSHREMQRLLDDRTGAVMEAWTSVFSRQQDILVWPTAELKQDFVDEFADLIPIELKVPFPTPEEEEKLPALRTRYQNYIGSVLPSIAEIAKAKWTADFESQRGGMGMGMGMGAGMGMGMPGDMGGMTGGGEDMYGGGGAGLPGGMGGLGGLPAKDDGALVTWSTSSQEQLLADLFPWRKGPGGPPPSTLDVLYSQENLWILRQLMQIVALVNGDVGQRHQAKIREINRIAIGRSVPKAAGVIAQPGSGMAGGMGSGGMLGMEGGMPGMGGAEMDYGAGGMDAAAGMMGDMAGMDSGGGGAAAAVTLDPGDNRYVDIAGASLTAEQLRAALSSQSPTDAFMAVAKRVPIMLSLKIDQRNIPELLAVCGSVPLMVEVKHVRILPPGKAAAGGGSGSGIGMGMGAGMGMPGDMGGMTGAGEDMYGGGEGMPGSGGMGGMGGAAQPSTDPFPMDLSVEVYGIIYIYNPPNSEALGIEKVDETTVIEGTAMGNGPVAETVPTDATPAETTVPEATPTEEETTPPADAAPATTPPAEAVPATETVPPAAAATASPVPSAQPGVAAVPSPATGAMRRSQWRSLATVKSRSLAWRNRDTAADLASQLMSV